MSDAEELARRAQAMVNEIEAIFAATGNTLPLPEEPFDEATEYRALEADFNPESVAWLVRSYRFIAKMWAKDGNATVAHAYNAVADDLEKVTEL